ncbi:hypothetical protein F3J23_06960 [Chryseobacterium sp. Tr-659]|uniref:hypothetical protein n=1 Tax=Chryseobacterium sp. Tr-659 TaxID=2608340 RepID=UPI00142144F2|nr:hypothetical protein [Chryseobacterium sp. Tr-659]NIF05180.1 hypothetical protein [Chryseobacterium sp. Tr-659]
MDSIAIFGIQNLIVTILGMKKIFVFISTLLSTVFYTQKCTDLKQNIDSYGNFNISFTEKLFDNFSEKIAEVINIEESNQDNLKLFQNKFPEVYDGKCLKITTKKYNEYFFCDENQRDQIPEDRYTTLGKFKLSSVVDNFYFFKYSGFEISGYLMYNEKDSLFYSFESKPIISQDKKFLYSYSTNFYGFDLNVLTLDHYSKLFYHLQGDFDIKDIRLTQYKDTDHYSIIMDLTQKLITRDQDYKVIGVEYCNRKIKIN